MDNALLADIITEVWHPWPECRMVCGSPCNSKSNGGVERVNPTVQAKLGVWMQHTNSRWWSVGCHIVMWRYNTQQHQTVGNTPYRLLFGQLPGVGISALLLDPILLDTLATEAELNQLVDLPAIDDTAEGNDEEIAEMDIVNEDAVEGNGNDAIPDAEIVNEDAANAIPEAEVVEVVDDDCGESSSFATANDNAAMSYTSIDLFGADIASCTQTTAAAASGSHDSDSGDDEHNTFSELGRPAEKSGQFKTTGDKYFTA